MTFRMPSPFLYVPRRFISAIVDFTLASQGFVIFV